MVHFKRIPALVACSALAVLALTGCDNKGDKQPLDNGEDAAGSSCVDTPTVLGSVDELSALGFSAAEILALASGEHSSPIFWREPGGDEFLEIDFGPETGEGTLSVTIAHEGGEIRYIDSEPKDQEGLESFGCVDRLEIDVTATLSTGGGALAETMPVTLSASNTLLAHFNAALDLEALAGSFFATTTTPDATIGDPTLSVDISSFGLAGALEGIVEIDMGDVAAAGFIEYAVFPSEQPSCQIGELAIPFDTALQGFSAADGLALVNGPWIFQLAWDGGQPTALDLAIEHDGKEVCASVSSSEFEGGLPGSLRFGATVSLDTAEGVAASFPIVVSAEPDDMGNLGQVHVWNEAPYGSLVESAAFAESFGEFGVDVSGYDFAGIEFAGAFAPSDQPGSADGSLTVLAGDDPNCSDVPGEPCMGIDVVELARAEWGNTGVEP